MARVEVVLQVLPNSRQIVAYLNIRGTKMLRRSGAGTEFHRAGAVRPELPRCGVEVLPEADVGAPFGGAPRGLAQAARGGLATGSVRGTEAGSRLVRIDL